MIENIYGAWERFHALKFIHAEYGTLYRNNHGEWEQIHPEDGLRGLKAETLKDALVEAETEYEKAKPRAIKTVKRMRTTKPKEDKVKAKKPNIKKTKKNKSKKAKVKK
jgi:hypothetical protein